MRSPALAGRVTTCGLERHGGKPRLRILERRPDDTGNVDLVQLARGFLLRREPGDVHDLVGVPAVAVVEKPLVVPVDDLVRHRSLVCGCREELGRLVLRPEGALGERFPDEGGERSSRDRISLEFGHHRSQGGGVTHPDRDRKLGGVPDEPGVPVVLGRARLPGDRPVEEGRSPPSPAVNDLGEDRGQRCRLVGVENLLRGGSVLADPLALGLDESGGASPCSLPRPRGPPAGRSRGGGRRRARRCWRTSRTPAPSRAGSPPRRQARCRSSRSGGC